MCLREGLYFLNLKGVVSNKTLVTLSTTTALSVPIAALRTNPKIYPKNLSWAISQVDLTVKVDGKNH